jgi:hypothetical protein
MAIVVPPAEELFLSAGHTHSSALKRWRLSGFINLIANWSIR